MQRKEIVVVEGRGRKNWEMEGEKMKSKQLEFERLNKENRKD
jgi:hypothetical protein